MLLAGVLLFMEFVEKKFSEVLKDFLQVLTPLYTFFCMLLISIKPFQICFTCRSDGEDQHVKVKCFR